MLAFFLVALVSSAAQTERQAAAPAPDPRILGQWESAVRNKGGVGNILEFRPDGTVVQISAAMGDTTYKILGEYLRTYWTDEATGEVREADVRVEFEGADRFVEKGEDGTEQGWSERIGSAPRSGAPVVGQWCSLFLDTLTNYREFTPDGKLFVRMPITVLRGTYSVTGDTLGVKIDGQPPGEYPFRFENGQMLIKSRDGSDRAYKRTECTLLKGY